MLYGDPTMNTLHDWNVKFVNFLTEHKHIPSITEGFPYVHEDEKYLAQQEALANRMSKHIGKPLK